MAMKKTSGGNSPLRQGAGKSFWTLPILGRRWRWIAICFWKSDWVFRFFPSGVLYRRRGGVRSGPGAHTTGQRGRGAGRTPWWCGRPVAPFRLLFGSLEASVNILTSGFCFVQFQEYFLYNFSETQKQQKTGNSHCGISLIGYVVGMTSGACQGPSYLPTGVPGVSTALG
jgi:hypothetical protein